MPNLFFRLMIKSTSLQFARQIECAKAAGIYDAMFLAFGSLLGYVRNHGMVPGDDDMDVGFVSEMITKDQELEYLKLIGEPTDYFKGNGLFEYRKKTSNRMDNGRLFWISVRGRPSEECFKCCHWFFWRQYGIDWHCKGRDCAVKGIRSGLIEPGPEVEFLGSKIRIPKLSGSCLDAWYPDWGTPRSGGNSSGKITMSVDSWNEMKGTIKIGV